VESNLVERFPKKSWPWAAPWWPGWTIGSSEFRWVKSHLTAKLAPWSREAADAAGADERAARKATPLASRTAKAPEANSRTVFLVPIPSPL
jgi:hypothetical protein